MPSGRLNRGSRGWSRKLAGKVMVEERDVATTVLVSRAKFLNEQRELAKKFVQAHRRVHGLDRKNPDEAQRLIQSRAAGGNQE